MTSDKTTVSIITSLCKRKGYNQVVCSPGSRNAPFTVSFGNDSFFECCNIPDERVAAFFAMGWTLRTGIPTIIYCTSGSALLNYAPAIVEAYYQQIPLIIISADRPEEWIDQRAGQTIRQIGVFENYIVKSIHLNSAYESDTADWYHTRQINEVLEACIHNHPPGPVHINVALKEPLYDFTSEEIVPQPITTSYIEKRISDFDLPYYTHQLKNTDAVLLVCGQHQPDEAWQKAIDQIARLPQVVCLTECTSNVDSDAIISTVDRTIVGISDDDIATFTPKLLISIGKAIVSKKLRFMLRKMDVKAHWQIEDNPQFTDTYQKLSHHIPVSFVSFMAQLQAHHSDMRFNNEQHNTNFKNRWFSLASRQNQRHDKFLHKIPYCDLMVFDAVWKQLLPSIKHVHLANSTPIRYAQLWNVIPSVQYFCNRGVSGIDGCSSTAVGYAFEAQEAQLLITGDIAFFYDSNAFWHHHISPHLKVIMINNQGGNIFRIIPGPARSGQLEKHFETHHDTSAKHLAAMHDISYHLVKDKSQLNDGLSWLLEQSQAAILEIYTPRNSADYLKAYMQELSR